MKGLSKIWKIDLGSESDFDRIQSLEIVFNFDFCVNFIINCYSLITLTCSVFLRFQLYIPQPWTYLNIFIMQQCCFASFNTKGFSSSIESGLLPQPDHITYQGAFNELTFTIGKKAQKSMELHVGYSRCQNLNSSFDSQIHDYLAIFTKGSKDGQDRDERVLNSVICLDISGSMNGSLSQKGNGVRLALAKEAIKMFFSKMRPNDAFGLVTFNDKGYTIIPCRQKNQLDTEFVFSQLEKIKTNGGTTLMSGFNRAKQQLLTYLGNKNYSKQSGVQNRILMLTDVCDNSVANSHTFVKQVAQKCNIHTTIIGISDEFDSKTCQQLNQVEGFNYFCATENQDLKKYLFQNFNFTFFPSNYNIQIELIQNKNVKQIQVFGTVDAKRVKEYNGDFKKHCKNLIITKTKTSFPSEIQLTGDGILKQFGGLVVVKLNLQSPGSDKFETKIKLSYTTPKGQKEEQIYPVSFQVPANEQFYSEECLAQAMPGFFYVYEVRNILEKTRKGHLTAKQNRQYVNSLQNLKGICPKSKLKQLEDMIKILKDRIVNNQNEEEGNLEQGQMNPKKHFGMF